MLRASACDSKRSRMRRARRFIGQGFLFPSWSSHHASAPRRRQVCLRPRQCRLPLPAAHTRGNPMAAPTAAQPFGNCLHKCNVDAAAQAPRKLNADCKNGFHRPTIRAVRKRYKEAIWCSISTPKAGSRILPAVWLPQNSARASALWRLPTGGRVSSRPVVYSSRASTITRPRPRLTI